jgi:hypothetical protein
MSSMVCRNFAAVFYENNFKTLPGKCALEIRFPLCGRNDLDSVAEIIVAADLSHDACPEHSDPNRPRSDCRTLRHCYRRPATGQLVQRQFSKAR